MKKFSYTFFQFLVHEIFKFSYLCFFLYDGKKKKTILITQFGLLRKTVNIKEQRITSAYISIFKFSWKFWKNSGHWGAKNTINKGT